MTLPLAGTTKNRALSLIMRRRALSRKALSDELGVSRASVTHIAGELLQDGLIIECGTADYGAVGRREILLRPCADGGFAVGVDVSLHKATVTAVALDLTVLHEKEFAYPVLDAQAADAMLAHAHKLVRRYGQDRCIGCGVLAQGYIEDGLLRTLPVPDLLERTQAALGVPCVLFNNVRAMALTEQFCGGTPDDFVLLKYGPGVGCAIVNGGKIMQGRAGAAGEIGHIKWSAQSDALCGVCGKRGCLEACVCYDAVVSRVTGRPTVGAGFSDLADAAGRCPDALATALDALAHATALTVQLIAPDALYLAGELFTRAPWHEAFLTRLDAYGCSGDCVEIRTIEDYDEKRRIAPAIAVFSQHFNG